MADPRFKRGARLSPRHKLLAAEPFKAPATVPAQFAVLPKKTDYWGNNQYGDCVSAEEAFAKATADVDPECFISTDTVISWARQNGFLNGADLTEVMEAMAKSGFMQGGKIYGDGPYKGVDYTDEGALKAALCVGPVKIAIDAEALPAGAGNKNGWYAFEGRQYNNTDHCVALHGYGPADYLFSLLGVPTPAGAPGGTLFLLYTWNTVGVVSLAWLKGTCKEAWIRSPTSTNNGAPMPQPKVEPAPTPGPTPTPTPGPSPTPTPGPSPDFWARVWALLVEYGPGILSFIISLLSGLNARLAAARAQGGQDQQRPA